MHVGHRSYDIATSATDYDWMLGAEDDVQDRIFGDTFDGRTIWIY